MSDRNDNAALTILGKIIDRMAADKADHDQRVATHIAQVHQINYAIQQLNAMNNPQLQSAQAVQMASNQYAAMYGQHSHSITYNRPTLASAMEYVPYLTAQEFEALRAWRNGEDVLLHLLSRE